MRAREDYRKLYDNILDTVLSERFKLNFFGGKKVTYVNGTDKRKAKRFPHGIADIIKITKEAQKGINNCSLEYHQKSIDKIEEILRRKVNDRKKTTNLFLGYWLFNYRHQHTEIVYKGLYNLLTKEAITSERSSTPPQQTQSSLVEVITSEQSSPPIPLQLIQPSPVMEKTEEEKRYEELTAEVKKLEKSIGLELVNVYGKSSRAMTAWNQYLRDVSDGLTTGKVQFFHNYVLGKDVNERYKSNKAFPELECLVKKYKVLVADPNYQRGFERQREQQFIDKQEQEREIRENILKHEKRMRRMGFTPCSQEASASYFS